MANQTEQLPVCPDCGSRMWKIGKRLINRRGDRKQEYRCSRCRRKTVNPIFKAVR